MAGKSLLAIDDCLIGAADPFEADECLVDPAAKAEIVQEVDTWFFAPVACALCAVLLFVAAATPNADQGIGELGTPQRVETEFEYSDATRLPGPPAF